jgi:hypothetical protein
MAFSVALALTVPDPRKIRLQRERQARPDYNPVLEALEEKENTRGRQLLSMSNYARKTFGEADSKYIEIRKRLSRHEEVARARAAANIHALAQPVSVHNPLSSSGPP